MINTENKTDTARSRSHIYNLLATIYRQEPTAQFLARFKTPEVLASLNEIGIHLDEQLISKNEAELAEDLAVEFCRLFIGPGPRISPPYESVYVAKTGEKLQLWSESTVQVKHFIETLGLKFPDDWRGIPDHISVELELMQRLTAREAEARDKEDIKSVRQCLELETKFMQERLSKWIHLFCDKVIQGTKSSFYREMARLTKEFIESEKEYLKTVTKP